MEPRFPIPWSAFIIAALVSSPADATRRCDNALGDGRFIVQGPLLDEVGLPCSMAVIPRRANSFSNLVVIENTDFAGEIVVVSPPFARQPHRVVIVEPFFIDRGSRFSSRPASENFSVRPFASFTPEPRGSFTTGPLGPFTTGPPGPFTTESLGRVTPFSNSRSQSRAAVATSPLGPLGSRR
jgi:hypothetical protein